jgi:hypothetical protein
MRSERLRHRGPAAALLAALAALLVHVPLAAGAPALSWTTASAFDLGHVTSGLSCGSESLCVAVDREGDELSSTDPTQPSASWSRQHISAAALNGVSCAPEGLCVAVDASGAAVVGATGAASWSSTPVDAGHALSGVSCPQASLCVAVDSAGRVLTSTRPASGNWSPALIDAEHPSLRAVSCASPTRCVAVDSAGDVLSSSNPTGGASAWHLLRIAGEELTGVSCSTAGVCVAVDAAGDVFASSDPTGGGWTGTAIDAERFEAVSCAASAVCVAVDGRGEALASDEAAAPVPAWAASRPSGEALSAVSCLPGGSCLALSAGGRSLLGRVSAPVAVTLLPTVVTADSASVAGAVDPRDAVLSACRFEYGTSAAYGQSLPCAARPAPSGGNQSVGAQLEGLSPNTTYHYRLLVASPEGSAQGADVTFTTAVSSAVPIVQPHPSIAGTPAVGQRLTCRTSTTPAGVSAQLSYAWLLDLIPVSGATASTYQVRGRDSGHHLQCQVTAVDGGGSASAKSVFVTIPVGGAPASTGETQVGRVAVRRAGVSVPVSCSAQAPGGCRISLRLVTGGVRRGRRVSVTLARAAALLARGTHRSLALSLSGSARRLLAARRRLSATLQVSGTVIGVIEGQLSSQAVTLRASARHASKAATASPRTATLAADRRAPGTRAEVSAAGASARVLAATPYMGWDTYFALGGRVSEAKVLQQASEVISLGLQSRGYRYIWLDVGWWHGMREADGRIAVSAGQWPHGLAWLTRTLHAAGFLVGLYTDAGPDGCGGAGQGSYGHYQQDADTFAAWGFDAVKVDFCGGSERHLDPATAYTDFHRALAANAAHRPMLLSICDFLQPEQQGEGLPGLTQSAFTSFTFGPAVGNSWRTDTDVGTPGNVSFGGVLRNMDADAASPQAAGPGHWNDPDYLGPDQGMSATQFRTQVSMWAMLAAPLMVSADLTKIGHSSVASLENPEVVAIDQDPAGVQGTLLAAAGSAEVWVKPLADGSRAVALLNRGTSPLAIGATASTVGLAPSQAYVWRDLWTHRTRSRGSAVTATVPGGATVLLRVSTG